MVPIDMLAILGVWLKCPRIALLKPRIQKVVYSKDWRDGKPVSREGISHVSKYMTLESYEDTLNNLSLRRMEVLGGLIRGQRACSPPQRVPGTGLKMRDAQASSLARRRTVGRRKQEALWTFTGKRSRRRRR